MPYKFNPITSQLDLVRNLVETIPLTDLSDVTITSPADNELLAYDTSSGEWINQTPAEVGLDAIYLKLDGTNSPMTGSIQMGDNSITGIDTLTFTDVNGTIAGIENQNLLDKTAIETVTGAYTFDDVTSLTMSGDIVMANNNITGMGNITGTDVDISAGTGDYTTSGLGTFGNLDVDTLNLNGNSITDSTGTILFDDENLTTTGNITATELIATLQTTTPILQGGLTPSSSLHLHAYPGPYVQANSGAIEYHARVRLQDGTELASGFINDGKIFFSGDIDAQPNNNFIVSFANIFDDSVFIYDTRQINSKFNTMLSNVTVRMTEPLSDGNSVSWEGFRAANSWEVDLTGTGTTPNLVGFNSLPSMGRRTGGSGTAIVTNMDGYRSKITVTNGGTAVTGCGLRVFNGAGAGAITTQVGVDVEDLTKGTTNFSLRTGSAQNEFGGDTYWVNDGSGLAYGNMGQDNIPTTVTINTAGVAEIVDGMSGGESNLITFQNAQELKVTKAGRYFITWAASFNMASGSGQEIEGGIGKGGVVQALGSAHRTIGTGNDTGSICGTAILDLAADDLITIMVTNESTTVNIVIEHASLTMSMVGG